MGTFTCEFYLSSAVIMNGHVTWVTVSILITLMALVKTLAVVSRPYGILIATDINWLNNLILTLPQILLSFFFFANVSFA